MATRISILRGLDLPITGKPRQSIERGPAIRSVGLVAEDYIGMKPTIWVAEGDRVRQGQALFEDKKTPGVLFTSPVAGRVAAIHRGPKRRFLSLVVEAEGDERQQFRSYRDQNIARLPREEVREALVASGAWTAFRTRPFSKTPAVDSAPYAIFVTAIDTNPLAADPKVVIDERPSEFQTGLEALTTLTDGKVWLCKAPDTELPGEDVARVETAEFEGPHPAGLAGTHMHFLAPVSAGRTCWEIGYQDVIAIGHQLLTGEMYADRVVSVAGPAVTHARLVRTKLCASLKDLTSDSGAPAGGVRTISGSVFGGRTAVEPMAYLGRRHTQVIQMVEGTEREFLGWMGPGFGKFSVTSVFASSWSPVRRLFPMTTSTHGSHRAIVPIGVYEKVMPLDIEPTPLLKSLCVGDTDAVQMLGGLELDEEDLGLCSFVCASKNDYGPMLREALTTIERDG